MLDKKPKNNKDSALLQFVVSFVIPIIILTRFSSDSQLGPVKSLLLALAFPVVFEIYNMNKRKKVSILSLFAIGGILLTGAISLLGLSEGWLAIRRSVPYLAVSIAILISVLIKHPVVNTLLSQIIDMDRITKLASGTNQTSVLEQKIRRTAYLLISLLIIIAVVSYVLTLVIIDSQTDTSAFNQEYARLRILSLPFITLPLFVGVVVCILYLLNALEKITGLESNKLLKKR